METVVIGHECRIELSFDLEGERVPRLAYDNWVSLEVVVVAEPFGARFTATLERSDVHGLRDGVRRIHAALDGTMKWQAMEQWLELEASGDGRGHFELRCAVAEDLGGDTRLTFRTGVDQTEIGHTLHELDRVCAQLDELFPER